MFSAQEAHKIQEKKRSIKKETYKAILDTLLTKIKTSVENGKTGTFVNIPTFIVGYPIYDRKVACDYIGRQLGNLGYQTMKYTDYDLYVTWNKVKQEKKKEKTNVSDVLPPFINLHKFADMYRNKN